jgi:tetratricopeptide (TPR) repeat protein
MTDLQDLKTGIAAYNAGELNSAQSSFEKALVQAQSSAEDSDCSYSILLWLGRVNLEQCFLKVAEDYSEKAQALTNKKITAIEDDVYDVETLFTLLKIKRRLFKEAEQLAQELLDKRIATAGSSSLKTAIALHNLGIAHLEAGRFQEAESNLRRAFIIRENISGKEGLDYAESLRALAAVYAAQNRSVLAEPFAKQALRIREDKLRSNHYLIGSSLQQLAALKLKSFHVPQAEELWRRALSIAEAQFTPNHPSVVSALNGLAATVNADYRPKEAATLYERAYKAAESAYPQDIRNLFNSISGLGTVYVSLQEFDKAEPLIRRGLAMLKDDADLQFAGEYSMVESLITTQLYQGKLVDALRLFPDQMRAKHTSQFAGAVNLIESVTDFVKKNVLPPEVPHEKVPRKTDE